MLPLFVALSSLMVADAKTTIDKTELSKLQGTWQLTTHEHGGKKSTAKEIASITLEVAKARFTTRDGVDIKEESDLTRLDPRNKPATIDLKIAGGPDIDKTIKGICKRDAETLTMCIAEPGKDRPREFSAKEGTGHTLLVFKKEKKKP
jgi:uncharacterized protein (TIGR03067 family)